MPDMKFEIEKHIAVLGDEDRDGYRTELNLVSWYGRKPKYDIRKWNADHTLMRKGISLTKEEIQELSELFLKHVVVLEDEF